MPLPTKKPDEKEQAFIGRCMKNPTMRRDYPETEQRAAVCYSQWRRKKRKAAGEENMDTEGTQPIADDRAIADLHGMPRDFLSVHDILKVAEHPDFTYVFGPVLLPERIDKQGDVISAEEIQETAHDFMISSQLPGLMHRKGLGRSAAIVVESHVAKARMNVLGKRYPRGTWFVGMRVYDDQIRKLIKNGDIRGFSIGGVGMSQAED